MAQEQDKRQERAGLEATCRMAVQRILLGQARYDQELDKLCDEFGEPQQVVRPMLDRLMRDAGKGENAESHGT